MKKTPSVLVLIVALLLGALHAVAQVGNEWIDFNAPYYKISTAKNGIYKLTYNDLINAGVPVGSIDPSTIRIYHRGAEQAIHVAGDNDHQLDPVDYIEFYGKRNDGTLDTELYKQPSFQPHKYYNLCSDTTAYFLTYGGMSGRRMLSSSGSSNVSKEAYHTEEKLLVNTEQWTNGKSYINEEVLNTFFDQGEGFTGVRINVNTTKAYNFTNVTKGEASVSKPRLEILLYGFLPSAHQVQISVGSGRLWKTLDIGPNSLATVTDFIEWSDINASGVLQVSVKPTVGRVGVSYLKLNYPQNFNATGESEKVMRLRENPAGESYIEIQNAASGLKLFDITDPNNPVRIGTTSTSTLNAFVPNTQTSRIIFATTSTITPKIRRVSFRHINPAEHDYILLTNALLRKPAGNYSDPVKAYAEYRASAQGGGYDTLLLNIQQVYDQFNYGEISPVAVYHLMKYITSIKVPRYFFIVGKGLAFSYNYHRTPSAAAYAVYKDLVPMAGTPPSDIRFTAGLAGSGYEPAVPTGRLSAVSADQVAAYLDKIIESETNPFAGMYKKNLLHLSGGIEEGEPERFRSYVDDFKRVAEGYELGGKVESIAKRSIDIKLLSVAEEVNKGVGLITFFGHSSASALDFDIGYVTDPVMGYNNKGKYPMMLMHGCNVGTYFLTSTSFGEDWVLAANRGALGFVAHTYYGFEGNLKLYGDLFYKVAYQDPAFISKGIGDVMKETARQFMNLTSSEFVYVNQAQQMMLQGDPAAKLFGADKPDLEINEGSISFESFDGQPVTALTDSFKVKVVVRNHGLAKPEPFRIQVERMAGENTLPGTDTIVEPVLYGDTISVVIRKPHQSVAGTNVFRVMVDADHLIDELSETNNIASRELFIPSNGTRNLFPGDYAIVNKDFVNLAWQSTDVLSGERDFILEIDTARTFDSPYKKTFNVNGRVLARKDVELLGTDTLAYYWRTKLSDPKPDESDVWEVSSFTMIADSPDGWAQTDFPQFIDNNFEGLVADPGGRKVKFAETVTSLDIRTFGTAHSATNLDVSVKVKGVEYNINIQSYGCRDNSINLIAFDRRSTTPYMGVPFKWYNRAQRSCGREPWIINNFRPAEMVTGNNDDLITYVNNIPAGDSVVLFSIGNAAYSSWPAAAKTKLGELGISVAQINAMKADEPVVIFGRKGAAPGTAKFFTAPASPTTAELSVNETITGRYSSGIMNSTLIGPALLWDAFDEHYTEKESQDKIHYDIVGVKHNGTEEVLFTGLTSDADLSSVSASLYPYLRVRAYTEDNTTLTSPQVNHWLVLYTPVPEGFITFAGSRDQQSLPAGVKWKGNFGFINISNQNFNDSLVVRYDTYNYDQGNITSATKKIKGPESGDTTHFDVEVNTVGRDGLNDVDVTVNPRITAEQYYDNNVMSLVRYLNVIPDVFSPVMDVEVDGRRLAEGDFVSANPEIIVRLWDENKYMFKSDLTGMRILLTYPCDTDDCEPLTVDLTGSDVKWYSATAVEPFRIEFRPLSLPAGYYILHVEGADASGNTSGTEPYRVGFNVEEGAGVTFLPAYPNPFTKEVNFTVVLSGDTPPEQLTLQLVDLNGKIVREISPGEVHVGTNKWTWDGTDQYGNVLPQGVYIYKIFTQLGGKNFQHVAKIVLLK